MFQTFVIASRVVVSNCIESARFGESKSEADFFRLFPDHLSKVSSALRESTIVRIRLALTVPLISDRITFYSFLVKQSIRLRVRCQRDTLTTKIDTTRTENILAEWLLLVLGVSILESISDRQSLGPLSGHLI